MDIGLFELILKHMDSAGAMALINMLVILFIVMLLSQIFQFGWHVFQIGMAAWMRKKAGDPMWDRRKNGNATEVYTKQFFEVAKENSKMLHEVLQHQDSVNSALERHLEKESSYLEEIRGFFSEMRSFMRDILVKK